MHCQGNERSCLCIAKGMSRHGYVWYGYQICPLLWFYECNSSFHLYHCIIRNVALHTTYRYGHNSVLTKYLLFLWYFIGIFNTILSWRGFLPLSRLTYAIYLLNPVVIAIYVMSRKTLMYVADIYMVSIYFNIQHHRGYSSGV